MATRKPEPLYIGLGGHVVAIDRATGAIRWHNRLEGLGTWLIAFGSSSDTSTSAAALTTAAMVTATT